MKVTKKSITNALLLLFAAGVFILIGVKTDWEGTWRSVKSADLKWLGAGLFFMYGAHWLRGARWTMLTEPAGYPLNKRRSFYSVMTGYLVNVATSRGGEIARCALTAKSEKAPVELLIGTVVTERIIDFIMLFLVCIAALLTQFGYIYSFLDDYIFQPVVKTLTLQNLLIIAITALLIIFAFVYLSKRKKGKKTTEQTGFKGIVIRFTSGLKTIFQLQSPVMFILYSGGIWVGYWFSTWCVLQSLEVTSSLTLLNALAVVIFSSIGIAIPLPAGAAVWAAVSLGLQTVYGMSETDSETYGIFTLAFSNLLMIFGGAISYLLLYLEMQKTARHATQ